MTKAIDDAVMREGDDGARREEAASTVLRTRLDERAAQASDRLVVERGADILRYMGKVRADADCLAMLRGDPVAIARHSDRQRERRWIERVLAEAPAAQAGASQAEAAGVMTCEASRKVLKDAVSRHPDSASGVIRRLGTTGRAPLLRGPILQSTP